MKKLEYGRSMVEMLGVLAIIGVLSVGAIAGYQKAMMKYKLNKQSQQLSHLLNVLYRHKASWGTNPPSMDLMPYFKKLGEIPKEMIKDKTNYIYDVFLSPIKLSLENCVATGCDDVGLNYEIKDNNVFDICQNVYNVAKEHGDNWENMLIARRDESGKYTYTYNFYGNKYCYDNRKCIKDITKNDIYEACQSCEKSRSCVFVLMYKILD